MLGGPTIVFSDTQVIVSVDIVDDTIVEFDETFLLTITSGFFIASTTVVIADNEIEGELIYVRTCLNYMIRSCIPIILCIILSYMHA